MLPSKTFRSMKDEREIGPTDWRITLIKRVKPTSATKRNKQF